ncbi:hypothetical protein GBF38_013447 [Nibea albiflora]|uniref:Uncharacterized protein n=1 Tax=Nibea albiflora TaxID=240163 RepID=A0ACB7F037_NIBAL|nr:hypothetical protein GBF38_013447 [Nibea albiflora]
MKRSGLSPVGMQRSWCKRPAQFPDEFMSVCVVKWTRRRRQALAVEASRTVGDALMQLPRHCRVSPPAPTYTTTTNNTTTTQGPARSRRLSLSHHHQHQQQQQQQPRGARRVHAHQATEEQQKDLVWLYLSLQSHVGFVIGIDFGFMQG